MFYHSTLLSSFEYVKWRSDPHKKLNYVVFWLPNKFDFLQKMLNDDENTWFVVLELLFYHLKLQEPNKLLQPTDKTLKTMAIEFAEYQVNILVISIVVKSWWSLTYQ